MKLNKQQQAALKALESGENVFLTGKGGTGKSTVIEEFLKSLSTEQEKRTLVMAPTGIAAIRVGGTTIHRALKLPIGVIEPNFSPKPTEVLCAAERVIIDEISMVRFDLFEAITKCIRSAEKIKEKKIQLICVGDFLQLPPVLTDKDYTTLKQLWGFDFCEGYAFLARSWKSYHFKCFELTDVMRQNDLDLVDNLNRIRVGDSSGLQYFNDLKTKKLQRAITICGTNKDAEKINTKESKELKNKHSYAAMARGDVREADKLVPDLLQLAEGMRVMSVINDSAGGYQNGSLGTVTELSVDSVTVHFDSNIDAVIEAHEWIIEGYEVVNADSEPQLKKIEVGRYKQIPLRVAYAITIHKSQGQTYEQLNVKAACFAPGQLYVALSRAKSSKYLHLSGKIKNESLITSQAVLDFYASFEKVTETTEATLLPSSELEKVTEKVSHGGAREGSGRKSYYGGLQTKAMKVPIVAEEVVKAFLSKLNWNEFNAEELIEKLNKTDF